MITRELTLAAEALSTALYEVRAVAAAVPTADGRHWQLKGVAGRIEAVRDEVERVMRGVR